MQKLQTRRRFLQGVAAATASTFYIGSGRAYGAANDRMNLAVIGIGGRGRANLEALRRENIVALCDVSSANIWNCFEI